MSRAFSRAASQPVRTARSNVALSSPLILVTCNALASTESFAGTTGVFAISGGTAAIRKARSGCHRSQDGGPEECRRARAHFPYGIKVNFAIDNFLLIAAAMRDFGKVPSGAMMRVCPG